MRTYSMATIKIKLYVLYVGTKHWATLEGPETMHPLRSPLYCSSIREKDLDVRCDSPLKISQVVN